MMRWGEGGTTQGSNSNSSKRALRSRPLGLKALLKQPPLRSGVSRRSMCSGPLPPLRGHLLLEALVQGQAPIRLANKPPLRACSLQGALCSLLELGVRLRLGALLSGLVTVRGGHS